MHIIESYITVKEVKKIFLGVLSELNVKEPYEWPLVSDKVIREVKANVSEPCHRYAYPHKVYVMDDEYACISLVDCDTDEVEYVYIRDNEGNCVDRLIRHKLNGCMRSLEYMYGVLCNNAKSRKEHIHDYHDSEAFEKDFAMLTGIRDKSEEINRAVARFLEDITLCDYAK